MAPPWVQLLELIVNGEAVDASTPNRPLQQLSQRTEYLKALVDTVTSATGTFDLNASFSSDVQEGFAVYWNSTNQRYEPAIAALDSTDSGVYGNLADSAYALGICASKDSAVRGTVVFSGKVTNVDFSSSIEGTPVPGPYFLSSTVPGGLVKQKPPVGIHVTFMMDAVGAAFVMPTPRELLEDHIHYSLLLEYGDTVGSPGWTGTFDIDLAPAGAIYRYTEELDEKVHSLFPFYPPELVYFDIDGIGANEKVIIDNNGIWWIDSFNEPSDYERMTAYYTKMSVKTDQTMVTSLRPEDPDGILKFVDCFGVDATAGDLKARLNLILSEGAQDEAGYLVFKDISSGNQFIKGPVVESIISGSPEIGVSISGSNGLTNDDSSKAGKLIITFIDPSTRVLEGEPVTTSLNNAVQEDWDGLIPYVGLPTAIESSINYQFDIPTAGLDGTFTLTFYVVVLATVGGVLPAMTCDYKLVESASDVALQDIDANAKVEDVAFNLAATSVTAGQYIEGFMNANVAVSPGDQLHISVKRNDSSYGGTIGILKAFYLMESV